MNPRDMACYGSVLPMPVVLDGEMLRQMNEQHGYRYRQRQTYLQEDDRIEIIRRLLAGEKQSDLAREFDVTRAAICNTFKNRSAILARSRHVYEAQCAQAAKRPRKAKTSQREILAKDAVCRPRITTDISSCRTEIERPRVVKKGRFEDTWTEETAAKSAGGPYDESNHCHRRAYRTNRYEVHGGWNNNIDGRVERSHHGPFGPRLSAQLRRGLLTRTSVSHQAVQAPTCLSPSARLLVVRLRDATTRSPQQFRILAD